MAFQSAGEVTRVLMQAVSAMASGTVADRVRAETESQFPVGRGAAESVPAPESGEPEKGSGSGNDTERDQESAPREPSQGAVLWLRPDRLEWTAQDDETPEAASAGSVESHDKLPA
jgi:hypothetical protein